MSRKILLAVGAVLMTVIAVEAWLRIDSAWGAWLRARAVESLELETPRRRSRNVELADLLRSSANPRLLYELRPGLEVRHNGVGVRTDRHGFRVGDRRGNGSAAIRILGIGDSIMFGWGVEADDAFLAGLGAGLEARYPGSAWQVINSAVPGYNTVMEVETLIAKGLAHEPDVVVITWVGNDLDLPRFLRPPPDVLTLDRSFAIEWLRLRLERSPRDPFDAPLMTPSARAPEAHNAYLELLPTELHRLVGLDAVEHAFARLASSAVEHGFEPIVLVPRGSLPRSLRRHLTKLGLPVARTGKLNSRWLREHGHERLRTSPLVLSRSDPHPSQVGHELIARALARHFVETGLAEQLIARAGF